MSSAICFNLEQSKILSSGNGLTHYQTTILDSSKLKEFADNNFKFDENGRKLSKRVEFLLFPQCFQKACFPGVSKGVIVWEWVNDPFYPYKDEFHHWS